jgi:hypothetical protein
VSRQVHSAEGRALALDGAHEAGRADAVETVSRRHVPVARTRIATEREALRTWSAVFASPAYRTEQVREKALYASVAAGRVARGQGTEDELRAAEDDVIRATAARRRAS